MASRILKVSKPEFTYGYLNMAKLGVPPNTDFVVSSHGRLFTGRSNPSRQVSGITWWFRSLKVRQGMAILAEYDEKEEIYDYNILHLTLLVEMRYRGEDGSSAYDEQGERWDPRFLRTETLAEYTPSERRTD